MINRISLLVEHIFHEQLHDEKRTVYNFQVEDNHTYYVGDNGVLVHNSDESEDFKSEYVLESYKTLYTGRAGLTEYYIWDNDYDTRMKLNEPLERIRNDLWESMKQYV